MKRGYGWLASVLATLVSLLNTQCVVACAVSPSPRAAVAVSSGAKHACCPAKKGTAAGQSKKAPDSCRHTPSLIKESSAEPALASAGSPVFDGPVHAVIAAFIQSLQESPPGFLRSARFIHSPLPSVLRV